MHVLRSVDLMEVAVAGRSDNEGLTRRYRLGWRLTYALLHVAGPPSMDAARDPRRRMKRERAAKVAHARARRLEREGTVASGS
jgi:hypothetical protein